MSLLEWSRKNAGRGVELPDRGCDARAERPLGHVAALLSQGRAEALQRAAARQPSISHRILTLELRKLEEAGLVARTAYEGFPLRVEYSLSAPGAELMPLIDALGDWWAVSFPRRRECRDAA
ncbi:hxlR-like helix-turn-helix domain-containing protein [Ditylenchus destructor]|uniref:HxlR-like helix-turn-helix domain-containing protein n=1 Tax=Ditylenchus destructor TaxID=166010 RepID=A0AAD4MF69_9BILA|nr:hxlR-like helix-turn-helix domain-containing protein [Ditylenchus destructor]